MSGDRIEVVSYVGRRVAGRYTLSLAEWRQLARTHVNPLWWKREFIRGLTAQMDAEPGGPDQAERIRDAQIKAIDDAIRTAA